MEKSIELIKRQEKLNSRLADIFKANGIKNFRLLGLGNSISSGYSMARTIRPLLYRNESLESIMQDNDISLDIRHFARAQNNCDDHIHEWLVTNIKESEIQKMNRVDYSDSVTSMPSKGITLEDTEKYYSNSNDIGLSDAISEVHDDMANIVVYNGCTGSFLDNITRHGKLKNKLFFGFKKDTYGLEAVLKHIQASNRCNGSNTQVYICGAPDFLGLGLSEVINSRLRKIASEYPNTVYVAPVKSKFLYKPVDVSTDASMDEAQSIFRKFLRVPDIHYDEEEYLELNNHITQAICDNYLTCLSMINVDREFYKFSNDLELIRYDMLGMDDEIQKYLESILEKESSRLIGTGSIKDFYRRVKSYLRDRLPYDFYYIGKKNMNKSLKKVYDDNNK